MLTPLKDMSWSPPLCRIPSRRSLKPPLDHQTRPEHTCTWIFESAHSSIQQFFSNLTVSSSLTILKTPKLVSSRTVLDQAMPSLLILTATAGRGEVVDSNVIWRSKRKQLIIKTAVKYILHLFQQCEISEKELNIVDPVGAGPGKKNSSSSSNG